MEPAIVLELTPPNARETEPRDVDLYQKFRMCPFDAGSWTRKFM